MSRRQRNQNTQRQRQKRAQQVKNRERRQVEAREALIAEKVPQVRPATAKPKPSATAPKPAAATAKSATAVKPGKPALHGEPAPRRVEAAEPELPPIGFGIERIGRLGIRWPWLVALLVAALTVAAGFGLPRLKPSDAISDLFRSETPIYLSHTEMSRIFPSSEFDVLVVVEGEKLFEPGVLDKVRNAHFELELADPVLSVLSIFSIRDVPPTGDVPPAIFPDEMPEGAEFQKLIDKTAAHPLVKGKLMAREGPAGGLVVMVVSLNREYITQHSLNATIDTVRNAARTALDDPALKVSFAGAPTLQKDIRDAISRDRLVYNGAGFAVGFLINLLFFGRLRLVLISSLCPAVGVAWSLGALGWSGVQLNTLVNVIPPLVMVISFCDSMHLVHRVRRAINEGHDKYQAARIALSEVGPACALTMLVTGVSALSLAFTDSAMIRNFAFATSASLLLAFLAVILIVPMATILFIGDEEKFRASETTKARNLRVLTGISEHLATFVGARYRAIVLIGLVATGAFFAMHYRNEPRYQLSEQTPIGSQSAAATVALDQKLDGAQPMYVVVRWPQGTDANAPVVDTAIAEAHAAMRLQRGIANVWSRETMRSWLADAGVSDEAEVERVLGVMPENVMQRLVKADERAALITGYVRDMPAHDARIIVEQLQKALAPLATRHPGFTFDVAGLSAVSALESTDMINQLNWNLIGSILTVILVVAIAFRSLEVALLSAIPNLFPIFAAGAVLYLLGSGIEYASVIALDIAFGLAIDDTIHFLNHMRHERRHKPRLAEAVHGTIRLMGPVVIMATVVLVLGLSVTVLSDLPQMRLFGVLMMGALAAAVFGDLLLLPAIFLWLKGERAWGATRAAPAMAASAAKGRV